MSKILILDDNEDQLKLIKMSFNRYHPEIEVFTARTADKAFEILEKEEIAVIFVDYVLKDSNGIKFIRDLNMHGLKIPTVLITGRGDERTAVEAMKAGAYDYVIKDVGYFNLLPHVYKKAYERYLAEREIEKVQQRMVEFNEKLLLINSIIKDLNEDLDLKKTAKVFLDGAKRLTNADYAALIIYEGDKEKIAIEQGVKFPETLRRALLLDTEELTVISDLSRDNSIFSGLQKYNVKSLLAAPLNLLENHSGMILLMSDVEGTFSETDYRSLDIFFDSGCASLRNSLLFQIISKSQKFWQETFDAISDIIFVLNDQHEIIKCNRAFSDMLGISIKEVIGKRIDDLNIEHPIFSCCIDYIKQNTSSLTEELSRGGVHCLASVFKIASPQGEDIRIFVVKDITELRRLKEQLYHADKLASIGQLVSGVAHEINNPLTGILGYTELLKMKVKDQAVTKELDKIYRAAERCKRIVENLLTFSRQRPPEKTFVDINDLIESALELRVYWLRSNNIEIIRQYADDLPAMFVDPQQLQQVFINLLVNAEYAVQESNKEEKWIRIKTFKKDERLCIEFQDNGIGIPPDNIKRIFDPFFTTKPVDKGSGLGLSISHGIIKEHEGEIRVESTPGEGTTFFIELPIKQA